MKGMTLGRVTAPKETLEALGLPPQAEPSLDDQIKERSSGAIGSLGDALALVERMGKDGDVGYQAAVDALNAFSDASVTEERWRSLMEWVDGQGIMGLTAMYPLLHGAMSLALEKVPPNAKVSEAREWIDSHVELMFGKMAPAMVEMGLLIDDEGGDDG